MGKPINWEAITQQYDMMVKYASALKTGTAEADALLRRFTRSNLQHPTYQGLHELGWVMKTIFLCDYLSDVRLRQDIQEALNVIEQWNSVNGFIFSARGGELLSNRPEDQEMALLCLHLIQISLALVNTLLLQEILAEEKWKQAMKQEDWRGLTPLFHQHVNPYGRFTANGPESPAFSKAGMNGRSFRAGWVEGKHHSSFVLCSPQDEERSSSSLVSRLRAKLLSVRAPDPVSSSSTSRNRTELLLTNPFPNGTSSSDRKKPAQLE